VRTPRPPGRLGRHLHRAPIGLYRHGLGWLFGNRFLLLQHIGRRSGLARQTVLEVMRHDSVNDRYLVAAGFGDRSDWYRNILAQPEIAIHVGRRRLRARARRLEPEEAFEEISAYVRHHPVAARVVARLMGFPIDTTEDKLRTLAAHIPVVELAATAATD
jgi:deazaflavin-dependent oxidoreductase (nitroreductase family)